MRVEIINTGSELLLGQVLNTHLNYLAEALWPLGLAIQKQVTVPDGEAIRDALVESFAHADIVLVTGGLGPTTDDLTRDITASLLGLEMETDPDIARGIEERLKTRNIKTTARVLRQAERPRESQVLENKHGTAPGLYFAPRPMPGGKSSPHLFLLPGPPKELQPMVMDQVIPRLQALLPGDPNRLMQTWRVVGVPESVVEESVGEALLALGIELGYCARPGEVDVRIIGLKRQIADGEAILKQAFGSAVLPKESKNLESWIVAELTRRQRTLSTAESCTGGAIANQITNTAGSSGVFEYGFVTYANEAKELLGVPKHVLAENGAVSRPVAEALALAAMKASGADYALATTGIAGPGGGSEEKPVGTVYIALADKTRPVIVEKYFFKSDRATFKHLVVQTALGLLRKSLLELH